MDGQGLEDLSRETELQALIQRKAGLKDWYTAIYRAWARELAVVAPGGQAVEIGSGAGFARDFIPPLLRTDTLAYAGIDQVVDALKMPFADGSLRALFLLNVLHHLPDAEAFLREAQRVLKPGGLLMITDQHVGPISRRVLAWGHHEPFDPAARDWSAPASGPLAGANGALAWMIFSRDLDRFRLSFPGLQCLSYRPFAPLQYWLSGGLRPWSLVPAWSLPLVHGLDAFLLALSRNSGSFVHCVITKKSPVNPE
jgi:SAM-dependent methyltransferase